MVWQPNLGVWRKENRTHFRVWAPEASAMEVVVETSPTRRLAFALEKSATGFFEGTSAAVGPGDIYRYRMDGRGPYPDPASRYQPQGVHGPSQVVDASEFCWSDGEWSGIRLEELILYELHVGTFTPEGTFAAAQRKLGILRELGVMAVERGSGGLVY